MQTISFPLNRSSRGPEVADLQNALEVIWAAGALDAPAAFKATGPGTDDPWLIRLWNERASGAYGTVTEQLVRQFQGQHGVSALTAGAVDEPTAARINEMLLKLGLLDSLEQFVVAGVVVGPGGTPASGLKVLVFDEDLRHAELLGEAATNERGLYLLPYVRPSFEQAEGRLPQAADLLVHVIGPHSPEPLAVARPQRWPVRAVEVIDVRLPSLEPLPSEFERLGHDIGPLLFRQGNRQVLPSGQLGRADLQPHEIEERDLDHLQRKSGWSRDIVAAWADAARMVQQVLGRVGDDQPDRADAVRRLAWPFFHAWCRENRPRELTAVLAAGREDWQRLYVRAIAHRRVPNLELDPLFAVLEWLQKLQSLELGPQAGDFVGRVLGLLPEPLPADLLVDFVDWRDRGDLSSPEGFDKWIGSHAGTHAKLLRGFARTLQAAALCDAHEGLTRALNKSLGPVDAQPSIAPLAAWGRDRWRDLAMKVSTHEADPGRIAGVGSVDAAARLLQWRVEQAWPTESLAARAAKGTVRLPDVAPEKAAAWVSAHAEGIDALLRGREVDGGLVDALGGDAVAHHLRQLGAFVRVGLGLESGSRLLEQGMEGVGALLGHGPDVLREQILASEPAEVADAVVEHVQTLGAAATNALVNLVTTAPSYLKTARELHQEWYSLSRADDTHGSADAEADAGPDAMVAPTVRGMFGDLGECPCRPCESIFGLPAYLVDLLELLRQVPARRTSPAPFTAREVFFERRPHVQHLELGCENAEIELPHIDLAIEILEWHAALPLLRAPAPSTGTPADWFRPPFAAEVRSLLQRTTKVVGESADVGSPTGQGSSWVLRDAQRQWTLQVHGTGPGAELRVVDLSIHRTEPDPLDFAEPVHPVPAAEDALRAAVFPLGLPWDATVAEAAQFEVQLGLSMDDLLAAQPGAQDPALADLQLRRRLGLSTPMHRVLTAPDLSGAALWQHWGFADAGATTLDDPDSGERISADPAALLRRASVLRARTGLELPDLEQVLATGYVGRLSLLPHDNCKASQRTLVAPGGAEPDEACFDRLQRLVRLWRHLPDWTPALLDSAQFAKPGRLNLELVAEVRRLQANLDLKPEQVLGLLLPMSAVVLSFDIVGHPETLFVRVFVSSKTGEASRRALADIASGTAPTVPSKLLNHSGDLAAMLGSSPSTLTAIAERMGIGGTSLAEEPLTRLWRLAVLSRSLGLSAEQLLGAFDASMAELMPWGPEAVSGGWGTDMAAKVQTIDAITKVARIVGEVGLTPEQMRMALGSFPVEQPPLEAWRQELWAAAPPVATWPSDPGELELLVKAQVGTLHPTSAVERMLWAIVQPAPTISTALVRALTTPLADEQSTAPARAVFRDKAEVQRMLAPTVKPAARYQFVLDRLKDLQAGWSGEISAAFEGLLSQPDTEAVVDALRFDTTATLAKQTQALAIAALAAATVMPARIGGTVGLFDLHEAQAVLVPLKAGETAGQRARQVLDRAARRKRENALVRLASGWTGWNESTATAFLGERMTVDSAGNTAARLLLGEAFLKLGEIRLTTAQTRSLEDWSQRLGVLRCMTGLLGDLMALPALDWSQHIVIGKPPAGPAGVHERATRLEFLHLVTLANPASLGIDTLRRVFEAAAVPGGSADSVQAPLSARLGLSLADLKRLMRDLGPTAPAQSWPSPVVLRQLVDRANRLRKMGLTVPALDDLTGADDAERMAATRRLLAAKVGESRWPNALRTVQDALRKQKRDALVGHLLHRSNPAPALPAPTRRHPDDLYEHFLIDPQIQPCFRTTRILQAIAAVQQFVQRVLFGLEPEVAGTALLRQRWTWMRSYRLWEANRKVFAHPEHLLLPELLDIKSDCLVRLEAKARQGELTEDAAREAFAQYLDDVAIAGQTVVLGMVEHLAGTTRTLYVLGRTANPPHVYSWRRCDGFGSRWAQWTPWRQIELPIQGEHVMPAIIGADLHVLWVEFARKGGDLTASSCEATVHWARYDGRTWGRAESSERQDIPLAAGRTEITGYVVRGVATSDASAFRVLIYAPEEQQGRLQASVPDDLIGEAVSTTFSATLDIYITVWVKLRTPEGVIVHVKAKPAQATTDGQQTSQGYGVGVALDLDETGPNAEHLLLKAPATGLGLGEHRVWVRFNLDGKELWVDKPVPQVASGMAQVAKLQFVYDGTASGKSATELGFPDVDAPPNWQLERVFSVHRNGNASWEDSTAPASLQGPPGTTPWLSGYRELAGASQKLELPFVRGSSAVVFPTTSTARFHALATHDIGSASSAPRPTLGPATWHYVDGRARCFIDFFGTWSTEATTISLSGSGKSVAITLAAHGEFALISDAYPESVDFRRHWTDDTDLLQAQSGTFGMELLPSPSVRVRPATWPAVDRRHELTFDLRMPYAVYNWEAFLHAPLMVADQLTRQHRFELADKWLRLVFDPTRAGPAGSKDFLRFAAFRDLDPRRDALRQFQALARAAAGTSDPVADEVARLVEEWRAQPYRPYVVARRRPLAFLWRAVFAYLENLIAWADSLYRRNTRESIGEAAQLYVLAARILGPRPRRSEHGVAARRQTYHELARQWDQFGNAWVATVPMRGFQRAGQSLHIGYRETSDGPPSGAGALYFCVPASDKLRTYWDMVADRLFNIRHCRSIDGTVQDLPLTEPPIDPELLARAVAAGLDLADVVQDLYAPPPTHRYPTLAARAADLVNEAKALGAALLAAIEKRDGESLARLRSTHEVSLNRRVLEVRRLQRDESTAQTQSLERSREAVAARFQRYQWLLGRPAAPAPAPGDPVREESLLGGPSGAAVKDSSLGLIAEEAEQIVGLRATAVWTVAAGVMKSSSGVAHTIAGFLPSEVAQKKATAIGHGLSALADASSTVATGWKTYADEQSMQASHLRRRDEWAFQSNQAGRELRQIDKQIAAAQIRHSMAMKEISNQQEQIQQSMAVDEFLRDKYSSEQLYDWMVGELSAAYHGAYQLAHEIARRAERAAARELGRPSLNILRNDHWDGRRDGLLAAERLSQDLKRLDIEFMDASRREHEMTRHVSLRRLDPEALVELLTTGHCEFALSEWLFDMDMPGHYLRRLKTVSLSIPCVVGPYATVNCRLMLLSSTIRTSPRTDGGYEMRSDGDDDRFIVAYAGGESIVTSSGREDSGMFETNLRDERYLPFEHAGVVSRWRLELPSRGRHFDPATISDVVLHLRYTARDGGETLAQAARQALGRKWASGGSDERLSVIVGLRSDHAAEWARAQAAPTSALVVEIRDADALPYWMHAAGLMLADEASAVALHRSDGGSAGVADMSASHLVSGKDFTIEAAGIGRVKVTFKSGWQGARDVLVVLGVLPRAPAP